MTAQISDVVKYRDESYGLVGVKGTELFDPTRHGLEPIGACSACWRGFVCTYSTEGWRLCLDELDIYLDGRPPVLFEVKPQPSKDRFLSFIASRSRLPAPGTAPMSCRRPLSVRRIETARR